MWLSQSGNKAQTNTLENALRRIGREDIIPQCLNPDQTEHTVTRIKQEEIVKYRLKSEKDNMLEKADDVAMRIERKEGKTSSSFYVHLLVKKLKNYIFFFS